MKKATQALLATAIVAALLLPTAPALAQTYTGVVVQPGDTLSKIAARFCTTWQEVYRINQATIGPNPGNVEVGMALTVPDACGYGGGSSTGGGALADGGARVHATGSYRPPFYDVAWGDTLYSIAARFGTSVAAIRVANGLLDDAIAPGWVLEIGSGGSAAAPQPPAAGGSVERIQFAPGAIAASRTGSIDLGQPKRYILGAQAGQALEVWTYSHGEPLQVSLATAGGQPVALGGANGGLSNYVFATLPASGDYIVTVTPVVLPESPALNFDITVGIQ